MSLWQDFDKLRPLPLGPQIVVEEEEAEVEAEQLTEGAIEM